MHIPPPQSLCTFFQPRPRRGYGEWEEGWREVGGSEARQARRRGQD